MAGRTSLNEELDEIKARLSGKLSNYFPESKGNPAAIELTVASHRNYSSLYLFQVLASGDNNDQRGLAVKVFSPTSGALSAAQSQYLALTSAWPAFQNSPALAIPRPLDFFPELCATVTEKVEGHPLQHHFTKVFLTAREKRKLAGWCAGAGKWLRKFHDATALPLGRLDVDNKLSQFHANLGRLEAAGFPADLCRGLDAALDATANNIRHLDLAIASVHGDFTVDNVLVDGGRIIAIDLGGADRNAIYHDIASFLNSLSLIGLSWPVSNSLLEQARDAFLAGYFGRQPCDSAVVRFLRLVGMVSVALEISGRRRNQRLFRWRVCRYFNRMFRELIKDANGERSSRHNI